MHHLKPMLDTHPGGQVPRAKMLVECLQACGECIESCIVCADACLAEEEPAHLRRCIRLNLDCADICEVTCRVISRQTEPDLQLLRRQLETCAVACRSCGDECEHHAGMHRHCRLCADACKKSEAACRALAEELSRSV